MKVARVFSKSSDVTITIRYSSKIGFSFSYSGKPIDYRKKDMIVIETDGEKEEFSGFSLFEAIKLAKNILKSPATLICPIGTSVLTKRNMEKALKDIKPIFSEENHLKRIKMLWEAKLELQELPAEVSSFVGIIKSGFAIDKIVLIAFPDKNKKYEHLEKLKEVFKENINISMEEIKKEFSPADRGSYSSLFVDLWKVLKELINREKDKTVLFNATASYKIVTLITSVMSFHSRRNAFYSFEGSQETLEIPPFGMDWDYSYLDEILPFIQAEQMDLLDIPSELQDIYLDGSVSYYPLNEIKELYKEKRDVPFDYGERYINIIDSEELKSYLREGIKRVWSYMWIGDQIPETVEHSQRHSRRLMNLAYHIIRTMGLEKVSEEIDLEGKYVNGISYRDMFLFILGVAIYVHDLGHVYPILKTSDGEYILEGFPSLIRDLHNELTVSLIESGEYNVLGIDEGFKNAKSLKEIFGEKKEEVVNAIKLVCRYHRKHLPIYQKSTLNKTMEILTRAFKIKISPLVDEAKQIEDEKLRKIVIKAAQWLRFIDGLDVQADRTVTESYQRMRVERTSKEINYLYRKWLMIDQKEKEEFRSIQDKIEEIYNLNIDLLSPDRSRKMEEISKELESYLYKLLESDKKRILSSRTAEILFKIAFKARQFVHFDKHKAVSTVFPARFDEKTKKLLIKIFKNPEFNAESEMKSIKEEIEREKESAELTDFELEVLVK
ncbi:hypothetical protein [Thermotoga sp. SG1]|uniref:HD domain-containing protein n=1 Tax=Thermotoga sp. SG1 TaxID=126739 RepID=UPI000CB4AF8A|nr:hypothetical protein [Thermotoga sp. SG1]PLV57143.1 hypothetical protein AS006_02275 [Thermotoga sp. SG1]